MSIIEILLLLFSYLLGSIPFGYLLTKKFASKNILDHGSGNIGSTNVKRIAGKKISIYTQLLDMAKGLIPVGVTMLIMNYGTLQLSSFVVYLVAFASIIGHDFSIFLRFKGGKGVNTTVGASILIAPFPVLISVLIYYITKWKFKYVSLGSLLLALSLPISEIILNGFSREFYYLIVCTLLIIILHLPNINRLIKKTETK